MREVVQKVVKEWVEEANNKNVSRMLQDNDASFDAHLDGQSAPRTTPEDEETWKILADCQVTLPSAGLLKLVPRFTEKVATIIAQNGAEKVSVIYSNAIIGPIVMDEQSPSIKVVICG